MAEAYAPPVGQQAIVTARLDILRDESSRVLVTAPLQVSVGPSPEMRVAQGRISVSAVPPGAYLARVSFAEGGAARGALIRPFRVLAPASTGGGDAVSASGAPAELLNAVLGSLPAATKDDVLNPATTAALWTATERGRTAPVLAAIKTARGGQMTDGALEALAAGDQGVAAFVRGLDLVAKSQIDQAAVQFQTAMRLESGFGPARAMLGVCFLLANREKEAAGLLMSVPPETIPAFGRLAGEAWLKAGQPAAAVTPLAQAGASDPRAAARSGARLRAHRRRGAGTAAADGALDRGGCNGWAGACGRRLQSLSPTCRCRRPGDHQRRPRAGPRLGACLRGHPGSAVADRRGLDRVSREGQVGSGIRPRGGRLVPSATPP